jgi:hypothetical protein
LGDFAIFSYQLVNSLWVFSSKIACQFGGEEFPILGIGWGRNFFKATKKILRLEVIAPIVVIGVVDEVHRQNQVEILDTRFKDSIEMAKNYPPGSIENKALTDDAISNREAASKIAQGGPYRILKTFLSNHWKPPTE